MPRARLIDLTRSLRRAGQLPTGVDRVELAYLDQFLSDANPVFGLVRTPFGYLLLDRVGLTAAQARLAGHTPWGPASVLSRLAANRGAHIVRAESDLRRLAVMRARRGALSPKLRRLMPGGFDYFNVGHSNLTTRVFEAVHTAQGTAHVLVHDVIPLDYPQYQRPGTVARFEAKLQRVGRHADRIIFNSEDTRLNTQRWLSKWGRVPASVVAHLGVTPPIPVPEEVPAPLWPEGPYFVTVGTIEPRKNHAFLLDLWEQMGTRAPLLVICGSRGWNNAAVFDRLDRLPSGSRVTEVSGLSDGAVAALVQKSAGSLFPSHAEGFGLPPVEALSLGARVLCNDLAVLHEVVGKSAFYAAVFNTNLWQDIIVDWAENPAGVVGNRGTIGPTWADHFKIVLTLK